MTPKLAPLLLWTAAVVVAAEADSTRLPMKPSPAYTPLSPARRLQLYLQETYGPSAWLRTAFVAAMDQADHDPPEWRQGAPGYSRRFASRFGRFSLQESIEFPAGMALGEDPRYFPCQCRGPLKRAGHALLSTVVARNRNGGRTVALARIGGVYGGALAAMAWHPSRYTLAGDGLRLGNLSLAVTGGVNLFREFWPDLKRAIGR